MGLGGRGLLCSFVNGDGVSRPFQEDAGFLLFDFHLAEHVAGLGVGFFGLVVGVLFEWKFGDVFIGVRRVVGFCRQRVESL